MSKLFLTSSVNLVAADIASKLDLTINNKLVFIDTPAEVEEGDKQWLADDRQSLVDTGFNVTDYTITGKSQPELESEISMYDYIYVSGGNTLYLLKQAHESGFINVVRDLVNNRGKIYIGTSAGSIAASIQCNDYLIEKNQNRELDQTEGFGFVNFKIVPHWGSDFFREEYLGDRIELMYTEDQKPLILLTDYQYVLVENEKIEIINIRN